MNRLQEIEQRLAAIKAEIEAEGADLDSLETEVKNLTEERAAIIAKTEKRQKLINDVIKIPVTEKRGGVEMPEKRTFKPESVEYREAYLKNLMGKPLDTEERAAITASAVIPTQTMDLIIEKLEQTSVIYPFVTRSQIPGLLSLPIEGTKNEASWVGMTTASTDTQDTFDSISLAAYKLIKTIEVGADVSVMSISSFESFLVNALVKKMSKAVDNAIINGTGTNQPTGLAADGIITNTGTFTNAAMAFSDLVNIISDLPSSEYRKNAKFIMPSALYFGDVIPALASEGIGVDMQLALSYKILGYDVILDDYMPADTIIFGDPSYYHFNFASPVTIESDKSIGFRSGSTVFRAMALADGKPTNIEAFNKYTRAAV